MRDVLLWVVIAIACWAAAIVTLFLLLRIAGVRRHRTVDPVLT